MSKRDKGIAEWQRAIRMAESILRPIGKTIPMACRGTFVVFVDLNNAADLDAVRCAIRDGNDNLLNAAIPVLLPIIACASCLSCKKRACRAASAYIPTSGQSLMIYPVCQQCLTMGIGTNISVAVFSARGGRCQSKP